IANLSVSYGGRPALARLSGRFPAGSLTAIIGPNGAGKSTLLRAIAGIVPTRSGSIAASPRRSRIAYLPQQSVLDRGSRVGAGELAALGAWRSFGAFRAPPPELAARVASALEQVGLAGSARRPIADLSVGQLQRALFARLLVQDAGVLLLDE